MGRSGDRRVGTGVRATAVVWPGVRDAEEPVDRGPGREDEDVGPRPRVREAERERHVIVPGPVRVVQVQRERGPDEVVPVGQHLVVALELERIGRDDADQPHRRRVPAVDLGADRRPFLPDHAPRSTVRRDPQAAPHRLAVGEHGAHELEVAGRPERQAEAVEQPVDQVVEEHTLARRLGVRGRRLLGLEVVPRRERHPAAQAVRGVPDRHAHDAGDADPPDRDVREGVREGEPRRAGQEPGTGTIRVVIGAGRYGRRRVRGSRPTGLRQGDARSGGAAGGGSG